MKRSVIETILGGVVLFIAAFFLAFSYKTANITSGSGYDLVADFSGIGGLKAGDDVQISGVKVGTVKAVGLNPETFLARVTMTLDPDLQLPDDTAALISSESLLGGRFMALEPGGSEEILKAGGRVLYTQSPQNLEQLLGQFIFSMQGEKKGPAQAESETAQAAPVANDTP